jgi:hypothetical protein
MSADTYQHPANTPILDVDDGAKVMVPGWGVVAQIPTDFWPNTPGVSHISSHKLMTHPQTKFHVNWKKMGRAKLTLDPNPSLLP